MRWAPSISSSRGPPCTGPNHKAGGSRVAALLSPDGVPEPVRVQTLEQISRVLPEQVTTVTDPTVQFARLT